MSLYQEDTNKIKLRNDLFILPDWENRRMQENTLFHAVFPKRLIHFLLNGNKEKRKLITSKKG